MAIRGQVFILDKFPCNVKNEDLTPIFFMVSSSGVGKLTRLSFHLISPLVSFFSAERRFLPNDESSRFSIVFSRVPGYVKSGSIM